MILFSVAILLCISILVVLILDSNKATRRTQELLDKLMEENTRNVQTLISLQEILNRLEKNTYYGETYD